MTFCQDNAVEYVLQRCKAAILCVYEWNVMCVRVKYKPEEA